MRKSYINNVHSITDDIMYLEGIKIIINTHLNIDKTFFNIGTGHFFYNLRF